MQCKALYQARVVAADMGCDTDGRTTVACLQAVDEVIHGQPKLVLGHPHLRLKCRTTSSIVTFALLMADCACQPTQAAQ